MYKKSRKLKAIREGIGRGAGIYAACKSAGITYDTLLSWRKRRKMIAGYIDTLLEKRTMLVIDALYKNAMNGAIPAQIFWLKNKAGWKDSPLIDQSKTEYHYQQVEVIVDDNSKIPPALKSRTGASLEEPI